MGEIQGWCERIQDFLSRLWDQRYYGLGWSWKFGGLGGNLKDPILLIEVILDIYDRADLQPLPDGTTFCNFAVDAVAKALGYTQFGGKTADQIVAFLTGNSDWSEIPLPKAQDMANQGSLLIAGLDSVALNQAHGHVCVIRPGKIVYSGKWGACPRVLNVGAENFIARAKRGPLTNQPAGLNEAFQPLPKIWVLRSTI